MAGPCDPATTELDSYALQCEVVALTDPLLSAEADALADVLRWVGVLPIDVLPTEALPVEVVSADVLEGCRVRPALPLVDESPRVPIDEPFVVALPPNAPFRDPFALDSCALDGLASLAPLLAAPESAALPAAVAAKDLDESAVPVAALLAFVSSFFPALSTLPAP